MAKLSFPKSIKIELSELEEVCVGEKAGEPVTYSFTTVEMRCPTPIEITSSGVVGGGLEGFYKLLPKIATYDDAKPEKEFHGVSIVKNMSAPIFFKMVQEAQSFLSTGGQDQNSD